MKKQDVKLIVLFISFITLITLIAVSLIKMQDNFLGELLKVLMVVGVGVVVSIPIIIIEKQK